MIFIIKTYPQPLTMELETRSADIAFFAMNFSFFIFFKTNYTGVEAIIFIRFFKLPRLNQATKSMDKNMRGSCPGGAGVIIRFILSLILILIQIKNFIQVLIVIFIA